MHIVRMEIRTIDNNNLIELLKAKFSISYVHKNEGSYILYLEKYYFRTDSYQLTSIIIDSMLENTGVTIISGGGGSGLLGISWGSESSMNNKVAKEIIKYCEQKHISYKIDK